MLVIFSLPFIYRMIEWTLKRTVLKKTAELFSIGERTYSAVLLSEIELISSFLFASIAFGSIGRDSSLFFAACCWSNIFGTFC